MTSNDRLRILPADACNEAVRTWQSLEARVLDPPLACSWRWTDIWLRHYGDVVPHRFAIGEEEGEPYGIALLTEDSRTRGPIRLRRLHLGTAAEPPRESVFVERNGVLVDPDHRNRFAAELLASLRKERGWAEIRLDGFSADDAKPFLEASDGLRPRWAASPWLELDAASGEVDSVLDLLGSRTRKRLRRYLRELDPISTEWARGGRRGLEIFDELLALHRERWKRRGQRGAFSMPRFVSFHRDLIATLPDAVVLFRVRCRDRTIACLYNLIDRGDVLSYQAGIADGDNRVSPGLVAHVLCMAACAGRDFRRYDFLAGDAQYKRQLTNGAGQLVWARAQRPLARILKPRQSFGPA